MRGASCGTLGVLIFPRRCANPDWSNARVARQRCPSLGLRPIFACRQSRLRGHSCSKRWPHRQSAALRCEETQAEPAFPLGSEMQQRIAVHRPDLSIPFSPPLMTIVSGGTSFSSVFVSPVNHARQTVSRARSSSSRSRWRVSGKPCIAVPRSLRDPREDRIPAGHPKAIQKRA